MRSWKYVYSGRGYLRFPEIIVVVPSSSGDLNVHVQRGGPSRVDISVEGEGEAPAEAIEEVVRRAHGLLVVYCQAAILDFDLGSIWTVDNDGTPHQNAYLRTLGISARDAYSGRSRSPIPLEADQ